MLTNFSDEQLLRFGIRAREWRQVARERLATTLLELRAMGLTCVHFDDARVAPLLGECNAAECELTLYETELLRRRP